MKQKISFKYFLQIQDPKSNIQQLFFSELPYFQFSVFRPWGNCKFWLIIENIVAEYKLNTSQEN